MVNFLLKGNSELQSFGIFANEKQELRYKKMAEKNVEKKESKNKGPVKQFRSGTITVSVWENQAEVKGVMTTMYSIQVQKRYQDDGEWKTSSSMNLNEVPRAQLLLGKAFEFCAIKPEKSSESDDD